jgi:hypothetical protein
MAQVINTRSPFFIKSEYTTLATAELKLYIYSGIKDTDKPSTPQYSIAKAELGGSNYVVFEISELVRDYIDVNFNQERTEDAYVQRIENDNGIFEQNSLLTEFSLELDGDYSSSSVWVDGDVQIFDLSGSLVHEEYFDYIAVDGYGYFNEGANPELSRTLLQSNLDMYYLSGETIQVPVLTEDVSSVKFYNNGSLHTTRLISSSANSSGQIAYPSTTSETDKIEVISGSTVETINVYSDYECKYTSYKVTFINKFGALQNIYFFKKSTQSINTTSDSYKASIFNTADLRYDLQEHQYRTFHKSGKESITMNTGFVSEEYNKVIKELMLSEKVWVKDGSDILPVNVKSKSLTYKTRVNDKLIQYTMQFDYAFDKINGIR